MADEQPQTRLTKFLSDQQQAVEIATSLSDDPRPYSTRIDAINVILQMRNTEEMSLTTFIEEVRVIERFLSESKRD